MGLLDGFDLTDPKTLGLLQAGAQMMAMSGRSNQRSNLGQILSGGLSSGMNAYGGAIKAQQQQAEEQQQAEMRKMQMDELRRKTALDETVRGIYKKNFSDGSSAANPEWSFMDASKAATSGSAYDKPQYITKPAGLDLQKTALDLQGAGAYEQGMALQKQLRGENYKLGKDESLYDANNKLLASGVSSIPKKELKDGYIVQGEDGQWKIDPVLYQAHVNAKKAGATSVNVGKDNLGLKPIDRFNMEGKLSDDYRAETKLDQGVLSAASKIKTSLSKPGAIADQATIYSFAKMLDPEGAVREADYAAIMNTAGVGDRVKNYVQKLQTGEVLSDTQRKEMLDVMSRFESVASNRISNIRSNYSPRAESYNLDPNKLFMDAKKVNAAIDLPPNPTASTLQKGAVYNTPRGLAKWNGMAFVQE